MNRAEKLATLQPRLDALLTRISATTDERNDVGRDLIALKAEYPHGTWTNALRERAAEMGVSVRTAQFYMQCAGDASAQATNVQRQRARRATLAATANTQTFAQADPAPVQPLLDVAETFRTKAAAGEAIEALAALEILLAASNVGDVAAMSARDIAASLASMIL